MLKMRKIRETTGNLGLVAAKNEHHCGPCSKLWVVRRVQRHLGSWRWSASVHRPPCRASLSPRTRRPGNNEVGNDRPLLSALCPTNKTKKLQRTERAPSCSEEKKTTKVTSVVCYEKLDYVPGHAYLFLCRPWLFVCPLPLGRASDLVSSVCCLGLD